MLRYVVFSIRVMTGSKAYLFFISISIMLSIFIQPVQWSIHAYYEEMWENVTACTNVTVVN